MEEIKKEITESQDELEKEQAKLKIEEEIKDENQTKLTQIEELIKKADKRLEKESERKQKMFINMKNNEREMISIAKETDQITEMIEDKDELRDMIEAQKVFMQKQNNIFAKDLKKVQKKADSLQQFISYGLKNNKVWQDQIDEDQEIVDKIRLERSRFNHDMDMARNSIEQLEQEIEMTEKKIKLIEKSIETGEKTYESKKQTIERGKSMCEQEFTAFAQ